MIHGVVTDGGVPAIEAEVAGQAWHAIVDTGFNGELESPSVCNRASTRSSSDVPRRFWQRIRRSMKTFTSLISHSTVESCEHQQPSFGATLSLGGLKAASGGRNWAAGVRVV